MWINADFWDGVGMFNPALTHYVAELRVGHILPAEIGCFKTAPSLKALDLVRRSIIEINGPVNWVTKSSRDDLNPQKYLSCTWLGNGSQSL
jgi:hypothetical protein